ncbi:host specificity factor TipJ family phage tail protein [Acinetobacter guillouiae]|uniref:host specificity factor TipJ family phage tail protein n=1 Tax=Acinetobacter guillouiae TaxID=106649 RepID=UPI002E241539
MKKTVIICPDPYDKNTWSIELVDDVCAYLAQQFTVFPKNTFIYHNYVADSNDVTPKCKADIHHLQGLEGTFYVVIKPSWLQYIYYAVVAIMAAFSVYSILTMPKPDQQKIGSSNNELANRTNKMRINSRVPDIYGTVRAYPDLIAVTYTYYENSIEVEECLMVLGRGYYQIKDCRDGETDVNGIDGISVSAYDPGESIVANKTIYKVGNAFTSLPLDVAKSSSINGQSLVRPNDVIIESQRIYFTTGGVIRTSDNTTDFTDKFKVGDGIAISGAQFGVENIVLSGLCTVTSDYKIIVESALDINSVDKFKGILVNGANVAVIEIDEVTEEAKTNYYDLSGQYQVDSIVKTSADTNFRYVISLHSAKQVNYNWNYITENYDISASLTLNDNDESVDLDANYSVSAVDEHSISLANATTINDDWAKIPTLFNGSTSGLNNSEVYLEIVANKWVGWFELYHEAATQLQFNIYFPQGLYNVNKDGKTRPGYVVITVEYQSIDATGNPLGAIQTKDFWIETTSRDSFGRTFRIDLSTNGNQRFRLAKTDAKTGANPMTECKVKDVYLTAQYAKSIYEGVTVFRLRTTATNGALSVKERNFNTLITRKLPVDGTGLLQPTNDAGQVLINMALDQYIGRRSSLDVDIDKIKSEIQAVKTYFNSTDATEFCYTFDDDSLSFEEQAGMVASACFCEAIRFGNKLRLKFEKPQTSSVLLFNHRNKVSSSEKRTFKFGIDKDYDGVELEYTSPDDDKRITYSIPENITLTNALKITTSGIRNHAVAKTRAWREWNKLQYQNVDCEFEALDESELLIRNDRILIADSTSLETQDGEIVAVDGLILTCSMDVDFEDGEQYYCCLQIADGSVDIIECIAGEYTNQIILNHAPTMALVIGTDRYLKTLYSITKVAETSSQAFMLTEMSRNTQMTNKLTCINYDDRYYEKDHSFL